MTASRAAPTPARGARATASPSSSSSPRISTAWRFAISTRPRGSMPTTPVATVPSTAAVRRRASSSACLAASGCRRPCARTRRIPARTRAAGWSRARRHRLPSAQRQRRAAELGHRAGERRARRAARRPAPPPRPRASRAAAPARGRAVARPARNRPRAAASPAPRCRRDARAGPRGTRPARRATGSEPSRVTSSSPSIASASKASGIHQLRHDAEILEHLRAVPASRPPR